MNIYKIAQSGGGKVRVKVTINKKTGEYDCRVIEHLDGAKCSNGMDDDIIRDLLQAEVPGFGDLIHVEDEGKTAEFFAEKKGKVAVPPTPVKPNGDSMISTPEKAKKKLDLGFGV